MVLLNRAAVSPARDTVLATLGAAALVLGIIAAYGPALYGGFLFDDDSLLINSATVKAADGLYRIWFTTDPIDYWPITNSSFWIEWRLWGPKPLGYHVTNVMLHACSALVLWSVLRRLSIPGAWLAAAVFALHPVNVQSVAWIAQRKNTLALLFFLLSVHQFVASEDTGRRPPYWLSVAFFLLAMLSKGSVATLPVMLLLLVWWRRGSLNLRDVRRALPYFAVAIALTLVNLWFQSRMEGGTRDLTMLPRLLGAAAIAWFYALKAVAPLDLTFMYPQWSIQASEWRWWLPLLGAAAITVLLMWRRRDDVARHLLFAWGFFCLALLPVMGFTDTYFMKYALVADHYQYIAIIAVAAAAAAGAYRWLPHRLRGAIGVAVIAVLGAMTWSQAHVYADAETFYRTAIDRNPNVAVLHNNLGAALLERETTEEAAAHLRQALRLQPDFALAHNNLCNAAARLGSALEAISECTAALQNEPGRASLRTSLAIALAAVGRLTEAREEFEVALRLNPSSTQARDGFIGVLHELGDQLLAGGRTDEAIREYEEALRRDPGLAETHNNLAVALARQGRHVQAIEHLRMAVKLEPGNPEFQANLSRLLSR